MFGWFRSTPKRPVDEATANWIQRRMDWLTQQFGRPRLESVEVILPRPEFFPDPYAGTEEDVQLLLDRVCVYMGIHPDEVVLQIYTERSAGPFVDADGKHIVGIEARALDDPLAMIAVMAHDVAHVHLLGHRHIDKDADDLEPLTDLTTVFLGMGVISANAVIRENYWQSGYIGGWSIGRQGDMTMPMYGYALALFALARGESNPPWANELRLDVRTAFRESLRWKAEGGA